MVFCFRAIIFFALGLAVRPCLQAQLSSVDSGASAATIAQWDETLLRAWGATEPWLRIRARPDPSQPENTAAVAAEVGGLARLRGLGFKPIPFYRWGNQSWAGGVRAGGGQRVPLDLREAYQRGLAYGRAYGAVVSGFEVENEPDISYVEENAETYLAFQKAMYLGLKQGALAATTSAAPHSNCQTPSSACPAPSCLLRSSLPAPASPLVVMAPLALPPGPYFEQLVANGLFSYTDAFNYHYYGYAEDFTGVYAQFEAAVAELGLAPAGGNSHPPQPTNPTRQPNPGQGEATVDGSATSHQAGGLTFAPGDFGATQDEPWMRHIGQKLGDNEAAPALAWLLEQGRQPYQSRDWRVAAPPPSSVVIDFVAGAGLQQVKRYGGYLAAQTRRQHLPPPDVGRDLQSPPLPVAPALLTKSLPVLLTEYGYGTLYGETRHTVEGRVRQWRWFKTVGEQIRALRIAGPMAFYVPPYLERDFSEFGLTLPPTPVALPPRSKPKPESTTGTTHRATPSPKPTVEADPSLPLVATGQGTIVLYNFSATTVTGRIAITRGREWLEAPAALEAACELAPGCRVEIPVRLHLPAEIFVKHALALQFVPAARVSAKAEAISAAVFATAFYPAPTGLATTVQWDFNDQPAVAPTPRPTPTLATGEPRLRSQSGRRWHVTPGVEVTEQPDGTWRFAISRFPAEPLRPAMAELSLPDGFDFPAGSLMHFSYRLAQMGEGLPEEEAYFEPYFRTANGNLYQVWPRQRATVWWQPYAELKENYTMAFYGRTNLPWRLRDNRIASLVFFFRPTTLPAVYEVKGARIVRLGAPPP